MTMPFLVVNKVDALKRAPIWHVTIKSNEIFANVVCAAPTHSDNRVVFHALLMNGRTINVIAAARHYPQATKTFYSGNSVVKL
ncbi:hypothetical protein X740_07915 [Mesorhizobium sp. LNHC221B00]|nr:hypothetical protein X740_07915 [Mesorhizobium sp. LNHC221B00]